VQQQKVDSKATVVAGTQALRGEGEMDKAFMSATYPGEGPQATREREAWIRLYGLEALSVREARAILAVTEPIGGSAGWFTALGLRVAYHYGHGHPRRLARHETAQAADALAEALSRFVEMEG
jgi:hypothetical protein